MATEDLGRSGGRDELLDLIGAVARGDAESGDVTAALRDKGVDSVDDLLAALAGSFDGGRTPESLARRLDIQRGGESARSSAPPSVHQTGTVPFLLRGTLYDPPDIERFQGQELHFTPAADGSHLIVVDDRSIMENWWQLSFLSLNAGSPPNPPNPHPNPGDGLGNRTIYYKDDGYLGWAIGLRENTGYYDLTEVGSWLEGDWNDAVSSVRLIGTLITVLHEHIHWTGSTLNVWQSQPSLRPWGWNDRASSLETW